MSQQIILVDFSSLAVPIWMVSGSEPDPNWTSTKIIERVRALASGNRSVAIACDSREGNIRKQIDPTYKQQREKQPEAMYHQMDLAKEALRADGFPVWSSKGYEADDVLASAVGKILKACEADVLIASSDKDILQLTGQRVRVKSLRDGNELDEATVQAKFGIAPNQVRDYLCLVGDPSDNVKGAAGIGPKRAAELLTKYGTIEDLYAALSAHGTQFTPAIATSLREFEPRLPTVRELITLRTDVPIPFEEVFRERVALDVAVFGDEPMANEILTVEESDELVRQTVADETPSLPAPENSPAIPPAGVRKSPDAATGENRGTSLAAVDHGAPPPAEWERQLEPRGFDDLRIAAKFLFGSKLFSQWGTAEAVFSIVAAGREFGLGMMASLRAFHNVEGKPTMSAGLIRGIVQRSPLCEYFRLIERSVTKATWATKRRGDPEVQLTYTIEEGRAAWQKDQRAWDSSAWGKRPANMVTKTCSSELCRLVYADIVANLHCPEELGGEERD